MDLFSLQTSYECDHISGFTYLQTPQNTKVVLFLIKYLFCHLLILVWRTKIVLLRLSQTPQRQTQLFRLFNCLVKAQKLR